MSSKPSCALVLTTIYPSDILTGYYENFVHHGHLDAVTVIVIGDRKTPAAVAQACEELRNRGLRVRYWSVDEQDAYLAKLGAPARFIPYDSDNRRNIGYLLALEAGADFLIGIDDDNFCLPDWDVFAEHGAVCRDDYEFDTVRVPSGWFNFCDLLRLEPAVRVYPRGFPYRFRHLDEGPEYGRGRGSIAINAGLWLSEPDLDGMSWLTAPVRAASLERDALVLAEGVWAPINSQNTALRRAAIPAYYFVKMGYKIEGAAIDRYGDIFSGYFALACARRMGHYVRVGSPAALHRRNSHHYLRDATAELACIWMLEDLLPWLTEAKLDGATYTEAYLSLSHQLEDAAERFQGFIWTEASRGFLHQTAHHMRQWLACCARVL
jgi:hypothetical protein